jgi:acyl carrier protein
VEARVRSVVATHLDVEPARLTPRARLAEDLCLDSLATIELGLVLEESFAIRLPDDARQHILTFGDVVTAVTERVGGPTP